MEFFLFLVAAFFLWLLIWSIVSVSKLSSLRDDLSYLQSELSDLRDELAKLRSQAVAKPPVALPAEKPAPVVEPVVPSPAPVSQPVPPPPALASQPPPLVGTSVQAAAFASEPVVVQPPLRTTPPVVAPLPPPILVPAQPEVSDSAPSWINWELFMGVRLFAWLGGLAAFLGVALFVKLSFENNWLPPEVRVAFGFLTGVGLLVGGVLLSKKTYQVTAQTLCATGVVVLYAVSFACRSVYHFEFFGVIPTFLLMVLITGTAFLLAVRLGAQVVAILGLLGGFLTPALLSTGQDNPVGLFGYIALLNAGLIAVALYRRWYYMVALAALGTFLMQVGWSDAFFTVAKMPVALVVLLGFDSLFLIAAWLGREREDAGLWVNGSAAGLACTTLGYAFYFLGYRELAQEPFQLFALVLGADLALVSLSLLSAPFARLHFLGGSLVFAWLGVWMARWLDSSLLYWALGGSLGLAVLHTGFPLLMSRLRPVDFKPGRSQYFAPAALLLVLVPVIQIPNLPFVVWPAILLLDLVAIGAAVLGGGLLSVLAVLVLSLAAVASVVFNAPLSLVPGACSGFVLLVGFFALLFGAATLWLVRRWKNSFPEGDEAAVDALLLPHLPVLSALLPFVLLIMVVLRLRPESPHAILGLALALSVFLIGLSRLLGEGRLVLVSLLSVAALEWAWQGSSLAAGNAPLTLAWYLVFYLLYLLPAFVLRRSFAGLVSPWIASAAAGPLQALLVHQLVQRYWPNGYMGLIPLAFALPSLASLIAALRLIPEDDGRRMDVLALFGGVALLFITAVIPVQFDRQWITLGWALEGVAVLWLFHRIPHPGLRLAGCGLLVLAFVRLALNPSVFNYHPSSGQAIFNWYLYAYGVAIACMLAAARLLAPPRDQVLGRAAPAWLNAFAGILAFLLLNIEIADYFSQPGSLVSFQLFHTYAPRDMSYTIGWGLYALLLLVIGLLKGLKPARRAAVILLAVTLLKLFLHDLSSFGQIYRVVAFIVVAAIALLASFLYQRFMPGDSSRGKQP